MNENNETIYLDQDGYNKLLLEIEELKEELNKVNSGRREAFDAGAGDGWDSPEFEEIERVERRIVGELQHKYETLSKVQIIERHNELDIVDILSIDIVHSEIDREEFIFKLVGGTGDLFAEIQEVSINSPLGSSVYNKKVGDICSYTVNDKEFIIQIKKKLNLENQKNDLERKEISKL